ncbi:hypothetical protein BV20DRAFT_80940 [Pilatotrama ljubarskyi]|nr:hypothetical protein BV20DRAFT_80940 [Pilatotrama ljubarskyi]
MNGPKVASAASSLAPSPVVAVVPALDNSLGAFLLGTFITLICYGVTVHQVYRYVRLYQADFIFYRWTVYCIAILATFHVITIMHCCYYYLVTSYFNPEALLRGVSLQIQSVLDGIIVCISQLFYVHRVYLIGPKYRVVVVAAIFFSLVGVWFGAAASVAAIRVQEFSRWSRFTWVDSAGIGAEMVADVLTTVVLIVTLRSSRTGFEGTNHILDRLIIYAVNTGLLIGIVDSVTLILAVAMSKNTIYTGFATLASNIYANSVLAVLNARHSLAAIGPDNLRLGTGTQDDTIASLRLTASDPLRVALPSHATDATAASALELKSRGSNLTAN